MASAEMMLTDFHYLDPFNPSLKRAGFEENDPLFESLMPNSVTARQLHLGPHLPPVMLPAVVAAQGTSVESHILFPPLLESIAHVQSAGLGLPPGTWHPATHMMAELQSRFTSQVPLGVTPELDEYLEQLIQLQHAQRVEMERIMHLVDEYKLTYENHVRSLQPLSVKPTSSLPKESTVAASGPSFLHASSSLSSSATSAAVAASAAESNTAANTNNSSTPNPTPILPPLASVTHIRSPPASAALLAKDEELEEEEEDRSGVVEGFIANAVENLRQKKRRANLPRPATTHLRKWLLEHRDHPYPTEDEKKMMCESTALNLIQINNWFINNRRRLLPQMTGTCVRDHRPAVVYIRKRRMMKNADESSDSTHSPILADASEEMDITQKRRSGRSAAEKTDCL